MLGAVLCFSIVYIAYDILTVYVNNFVNFHFILYFLFDEYCLPWEIKIFKLSSDVIDNICREEDVSIIFTERKYPQGYTENQNR